MTDYTWPSVYFAYLFFGICAAAAAYFFVRSWKDGYWGKSGEDIKYTVFEEDRGAGTHACGVHTSVDAADPNAGMSAGAAGKNARATTE